jgi:hypothetical protein
VNPCFDGIHNGDPTDWGQTEGWDVSAFKNICGPRGTAARINDPESQGESGSDQDEFLWQVVQGHGSSLVAERRCLRHPGAVYADLNIYGGAGSNGPWEFVWQPFGKDDCELHEWGPALHAETELSHGFAWYKFELHAMYTGGASGGVKFTSAYFESRP